jgi:hypothetical protein
MVLCGILAGYRSRKGKVDREDSSTAIQTGRHTFVRHNGHEDLYVTAYRGNRLYHNNGDGTFTDVTERSGTGGSGWSTSAAWVDLDDDGLLDLVALRYLRWDPYMTSVCKLPFPFSRAPVQSGCWIWLRRRQTAPASSGREAV